MRVIIDERERELYEKCYSITSGNLTYVRLSREVLPLGDIFIKTDEDKDVILIERKTIADLLSSIKDGRYEEQSYRLMHSSGFPPHSVIYIIEGNISQLRTLMEKKIVYSALTSLNFFKGFSVVRTSNVTETAEYIVWMTEKIERNFLKGVFPYYLQPQFHKFMQKPVVNIKEPPVDEEDTHEGNNNSQNVLREPEENTQEIGEKRDIFNNFSQVEEQTITAANYCTVVKKVKKDNVTPENIGEIILCQIPGISSVSAISIMRKFGTFPNLLKEIQCSPNCLDDIICETKGKSRKLGKNCVESIKKFLL
jgi:ERCC4-type nuclease